jgi:hypothetical protein
MGDDIFILCPFTAMIIQVKVKFLLTGRKDRIDGE